ncbi:MAG: prolipoprotein diacylglyceryl transferase [Planctomycetes bacterium]|nr:prolipoprotein diacylglyceryl transferase [Planctomycetota bacterium]
MIPELFELPFIHITVKSYGLMMVIGFLCAVFVVRRMAVWFGENPDNVTNVGLYGLIIGVVGARIFYVMHNYKLQFKGNFLKVFAVWEGGLEFVGGVILAIIFVISYLYIRKLSVRRYFDMLAVGLMIGLAFGRVGCFLNGCCYGKPTDLACGVSFPYASPSYWSQAFPDSDRNREKPQIDLPTEYFGNYSLNGEEWAPAEDFNKYYSNLKPRHLLTEEQAHEVGKEGRYHALHVHPTQLYSSVNALFLSGVLYLFWRKFGKEKAGCTFGLMFVLYGITRFLLETIRDDNPFEVAWWAIYRGGTISQNIGIYMVIIGVIVFLFCWIRPLEAPKKNK